MKKRADLERGCLQPGSEHSVLELVSGRESVLAPGLTDNPIPAERK
jgi:hypothetical protein